MEENTACYNCGGLHTANFHGSPFYSYALVAKAAQTPSFTDSKATQPESSTTQFTASVVNNMTYAKATKGKAPLDSKQVINLLTDLLTAITSPENPKTIMISLIHSFLNFLSTQNE